MCSNSEFRSRLANLLLVSGYIRCDVRFQRYTYTRSRTNQFTCSCPLPDAARDKDYSNRNEFECEQSSDLGRNLHEPGPSPSGGPVFNTLGSFMPFGTGFTLFSTFSISQNATVCGFVYHGAALQGQPRQKINIGEDSREVQTHVADSEAR